ncbi:MAG: Crp/Fnr family transcriptional regulator [Chloroflexia bacterium]
MARPEGGLNLRATDLFQDLSETALAALEKRMSRRLVEAGRLIYSPEERRETLFLLTRGRVRLYRLSPEGKALTIAVIEPVSLFGEMALLGPGVEDSFAEALEDCELYVLNRRDLQDLLRTDPRVARRLLDLVGRRLTDTERRLAEMAFKSVPQRLAALLLQLAQESPGSSEGPMSIPVRYTHQQLAEMIGTYRETVTKVLNDFRQRGWVRVERGHILVLDPDGLRGMASS